MKLFIRKQDTPVSSEADAPFWPQDRLDDVDDDEFARAIAAGRLAEQAEHGELVGA